MDPDSLQNEFIADDVDEIVKKAISQVFDAQNNTYNKDKVDSWCSQIVDNILKKLSETETKLFKYVVTCTIMQKTSTPLYTAGCGFWDVKTDGMTSVYLSDNAKTMDCMVTVYGLQI